MTDPALQIAAADLVDDRFSRFRLLHWWDQERIRQTNVLVVGAGALGNEILKNLALLGFERVVVVDGDRIELSNLSRSVLYRAGDIGRSKAEVAAAAFVDLYEHATVQPIVGNILYDVGLGLFEWTNVILAGLDNREARLWINRCAWQMGRPWIDGAIEGLGGIARVFLPGHPPCYECTLGETDWKILDQRRSCNLLTREELTAGKVPTTPTTSSVIAGIEVQEALKHIHGLPVLAGRAFVFDGMAHTSYVVEYTENPDCQSHDRKDTIVHLPARSSELTLRAVRAEAVRLLGEEIVVEFSRDIIHKLICPSCASEEPMFAPVGTVGEERARCPRDGALRAVSTIHNYTGAEDYGDRPLDSLGLPPWDAFTARSASHEIVFLISGDAPAVLGRLAAEVVHA